MGVSRDLGRVREVAVRDKQVRFTALMHHITLDRLRWAYWAISPKAAPGTDGVTWGAYGQDLEVNLADLHQRVHRGSFRATPSRRVYIPKADGRLRPLGIAALEDKIVQRAVVEVLNAVFEADFRNFSYGFRPQRGPHDALDALAVGIERRKVNWVLDADIRDFFSNVDRDWLMRFLRHRIADERLLRLVGKWLAAGVVEEGVWSEGQGTPQGASISPLLANVYLHHVLDLWADWWRRHHARGEVIIVRLADDALVMCRSKGQAVAALARLTVLLAELGLRPKPAKTRIVPLTAGGQGVDFLGFHHRLVRSRSVPGRTRVIFLARWPSRKAMQHARDRIRFMTVRARLAAPVEQVVQEINLFLRGWAGYFRYGNAAHAFDQIRRYALMRLALFIAKRHQRGRAWGFARLYRSGDDLGLISLNGIVVAPRPHRAWREKSNTAGEGRR